MADRILLESGSPDGYQLEDASGVVLIQPASTMQSVSFDGVDDSISIADGAYDALHTGTIEFWFRCWAARPSGLGSQKLVFKNNSIDIGLGTFSGNTAIRVAIEINGITNLSTLGSTNMADNLWHHVAASWDGSFLRGYLDGAYVQKVTQSADQNNSPDSLFLGRRDASEPFFGEMDEFRISDIARYTTETSFALQTVDHVTDANTLVLLHLDEGTGTTANDASTGGTFDGTLNNGAAWSGYVPYAGPAAGTTATPTTLALVLAAFAPIVSTPRLVTLTTATLAITTFAPVIKLIVTPSTLALSLTTFAPTVTATANQVATSTTLALTLITFAPVLKLSVIPSTAALSLTTFAVTVTASDHQTATPTTASLVLGLFAPTVTATAHQVAVPTTAALVLATFASTVSATAHQTATPTTVSLSLSTFVATVTATAHQTVTPQTATLTLTPFVPGVTGGQGVTVIPSLATVGLAVFAPVVATTQHQFLTPTTVTLSLQTFSSTIVNPQLVIVLPATLILTAFAPTASTALPLPKGAIISLSVPVSNSASLSVPGLMMGGIAVYRAGGNLAVPETEAAGLVLPDTDLAEVA